MSSILLPLARMDRYLLVGVGTKRSRFGESLVRDYFRAIAVLTLSDRDIAYTLKYAQILTIFLGSQSKLVVN